MASHLSKMYGTEEDKVNCPFYFKMGACRHGDRCSRAHNRPLFSQTVCLLHMYTNPMAAVMTSGGRFTREQEQEIQDKFEEFYVDVFDEAAKFGEVEDMIVCDNLIDHLIGNVYIKYSSEEDASEALKAMNGRWYDCRQIATEFSPVTEFREASCRQFVEHGCNRGGLCNFMHLKNVPRDLKEDLLKTQPKRGEHGSSSRADDRRGDREPAGRGGGGSGRDYDRGGYDRRGGGDYGRSGGGYGGRDDRGGGYGDRSSGYGGDRGGYDRDGGRGGSRGDYGGSRRY